MILRSVLTLLIIFFVLVSGYEDNTILEDPVSACDIAFALRSLLTPTEMHSYETLVLRRGLFRALLTKCEEERLQSLQDDPLVEDDKRSISSLARSGAFPYNKRSLEALARSGYLKPFRQQEQNQYSQEIKRSIATLAKNGQLPNYSHPEQNEEQNDEEDSGETKRSIEAMARNGYLNNKREQISQLLSALAEKRSLASLARNYNFPFNDKRNIGSLARDYNFPTYGKRFLGSLARSGDLRTKKDSVTGNNEEKRNIASIVRNGKRNYQSLLRNNDLPSSLYPELKRNLGSIVRGANPGRFTSGKRDENAYMDEELNEMEEKRNLASIKAQLHKRSIIKARSKRDIEDEDYIENEDYSVPDYQPNDVFDHDELLQTLYGPNTEKRFLGSVARSGWFRSAGNSGSSRYFNPEKRHIGSLARLGWLPAFRSARSRFSRSGRSGYYDIPSLRPYTTNGSHQINTTNKDGTLEYVTYSSNPVPFVAPIPSAKRYLLLPAVDSILLRKTYGHPHVSRECVL